TLAPMSWRAVISGIDGASRTSSVLGLKVRPKTATVLPRSTPANEIETFRAMARLRVSLTLSTASRMRIGTSWSCAVLISARTSFGKHEPPKPGPACRNFGPIRLSNPSPRATSCTSAPTRSQRSAISLMKVILVARNAFAAYLMSSAVRRLVSGIEDRSLIQVQWRVDLSRDLLGTLVIGANDDAIRMLEIMDRGAFAQEFRIRHDGKVRIAPELSNDALNLVAGANRHSRFGDDDGEPLECLGDFARRSVNAGQIGMSVPATRWSAHRDEHGAGGAHRPSH